MSRLLPYETILKAREGDPEAVNAVLLHYAGYIRYFSKVNGHAKIRISSPQPPAVCPLAVILLGRTPPTTASAAENEERRSTLEEKNTTHPTAAMWSKPA